VRRGRFAALLLLAFCFRLWFGLNLGLWQPDPRQVYLIGLKSYLTRTWPYFGADVAPKIQVPGALQGLAIALPLHLLPIPEAPFILLNLLSLFGLCLLAWYCAHRLPNLPPWLIWVWILTAPWTLGESTHVYNPSYVLVGSVMFFIGALETYPSLRTRLISPGWANFLMGLGLFWVMQFHMSYVILLPYVAASFYSQFRESRAGAVRFVMTFAMGALTTGVFLLPTVLRFGWEAGFGRALSIVGFYPSNLKRPFDILARFLSFASFEIAPFVGPDMTARVAFVREYPWMAPLVLLLLAVGILQPIAMVLISLFGKQRNTPGWSAIRGLCLATVGLLYLGFAFTPKRPHAHTFYVTFPVVMIFSLYCWNEYLRRRLWQICAGVLLACGIAFHVSLALYRQTYHPWAADRRLIERAIRDGDYREFDERRPGSFY
jgi:hypothetical protein